MQVTLTFTAEALSIVLLALRKAPLPFELTQPILADIQQEMIRLENEKTNEKSPEDTSLPKKEFIKYQKKKN